VEHVTTLFVARRINNVRLLILRRLRCMVANQDYTATLSAMVHVRNLVSASFPNLVPPATPALFAGTGTMPSLVSLLVPHANILLVLALETPTRDLAPPSKITTFLEIPVLLSPSITTLLLVVIILVVIPWSQVVQIALLLD